MIGISICLFWFNFVPFADLRTKGDFPFPHTISMLLSFGIPGSRWFRWTGMLHWEIYSRFHVEICANRSFYVTTIILVSSERKNELAAIRMRELQQHRQHHGNFHTFLVSLFLMMMLFIRLKCKYFIRSDQIILYLVFGFRLSCARKCALSHIICTACIVVTARIVHFIWFSLDFLAHTKYT